MILKALTKKRAKELSDEDILQGISSGENFSECIKEIYHKCYDMVEAFIIKNNGTQQDAEDIFQEAILAFVDMAQQNRFRGKAGSRTLMYSIARNMWLDTLRKKSRYMVKDTFSPQEVPLEEDFTQTLAMEEQQQAVLEVFEELGEPCKSLLLAYYYEELDFTELLERFKGRFKNEQVLRNRKSKCLKTLKKQLEENPAASQELKDNLSLNKV
jgi:RNA polymerase sigma factor (sigma-70 family)